MGFQPIEEWKTIIEYPNYQVNNLGDIKSLRRLVVQKNRSFYIKEKILKPVLSNQGYFSVKLYNSPSSKTHIIHRLVGIYFIPNPNDFTILNHIDGNKLNNHYTNLEWVTHRENDCHAVDKTKTSSKYIGVSFNKISNKWYAYITFKNKSKSLGYFETELEAYQTRCDFEKENNIVNRYL